VGRVVVLRVVVVVVVVVVVGRVEAVELRVVEREAVL
jgi:hypothetical protein